MPGAPAGFSRAVRGPKARYASKPRIGRIFCFFASSSEALKVLARPLRYSSPMPGLALTIVTFQTGPSV